jgi:para-aminobenzoate synthetase component 1
VGSSDPHAYLGGVVGWCGYEAGGWFVRAPAPRGPRPLPDAWLGTVEAVATWDGARWHTAHDGRGAGRLPPTTTCTQQDPIPSTTYAVESHACAHHEPARATYEAGVERIREHVVAGDCYQVNLAREVTRRWSGDPLALWLRLRARNPSRRGSLIHTRHGTLVSNSPELLLATRGDAVLSVPIKGTARAADGATAARELLRSPKERAELRMIVDLVRADMGRVARIGSVRAGPRRVGRIGHVWHAMQRVRCRLDADTDMVHAFEALFPAGSVTGAPRMRAMEVLHALEAAPRGAYCGAIGGFFPGGAWWNVAIRTLTCTPASPDGRDGWRISAHVGAGIVLGSVPAREFDETTLKAERLLAALS